MSVNLRRKHKALERALRKKFTSLPPHFKFTVHDSFQDTFNSITLPAGYTKPTQSDLETQYNTEISEEEVRPFTLIGGDLEVGTSNLYVNTSTTRVGIGKTNPTDSLDVVGNIRSSGNLYLNGVTIDRPPAKVIHVDDGRSGCPPAHAANTDIMSYDLTLSRTAYIYVSVTTILNYHSRADCYIYFNSTMMQSHLTASDSTSWNPVNITAGGTLDSGSHTISFRCNRADIVGCGGDWGGMQILVFET